MHDSVAQIMVNVEMASAGHRTEVRPASDIHIATSLVGLAAVILSLTVVGLLQLAGGMATIWVIALPALAMGLFDIAVLKEHRQPSAGLDFGRSRPELLVRLSRTALKLVAHWACWGTIALIYWTIPEYRAPFYQVYFEAFRICFPWLAVIVPAYLFLFDRYQTDPKDDAWHFGNFLLRGRYGSTDLNRAKCHALGYALKGIFLPMLVPAIASYLETSNGISVSDLKYPLAYFYYIFDKIWLIDVIFGSIGYVFTLRILNSHIRYVYADGWIWAVTLICYSPLNAALLYSGGYYSGAHWYALVPIDSAIGMAFMIAILFSVGMNTYANIAFGLRFSNIAHRGIMTSGPYAWFKHPAYLFKNIGFWLISAPFIVTDGPLTAVRGCMLILILNGVYYLRAKGEEIALMPDPKYRAYVDYIDQHGFLARAKKLLH
ncbi:isoprenylcysteine carboxylmethyltransferase family protein [Mesorhizobium sp. L2C066B000]|uniref:isoprenylcysteine carboxylmethyltransferase family protein n=1 Tax=Mesorhizobium sp. L2C066B000 TaxID=1287105 RepID=UPI0003CFE5BE|nr:isoprenylcysteine carboxylmethyltransferase family protein [Mesorhizobium sp. L2C066B000]ESZ31550.1 hypothetical protein X732_29550 [Mesorhizobium sp. L2C066B000]